MRIYLFVFFIFTYDALANNFATIDISLILQNNLKYQNFIDNLNNKKKIIEDKILLMKVDIEQYQRKVDQDSLIFDTEIMTKKFDILNQKIYDFNIYTNNINQFIENNILINENIIIKKIGILTSDYANQNNIDIIINSDNYFVASKDIDISNYILNELEKEDFNFIIIDKENYFED